MSKWVSNIFASLLLAPASRAPASRAPPRAQAAPVVLDDGSDQDDQDATPDRAEDASSTSDSDSDSDSDELATDEELLALLNSHIPPADLTARILGLAAAQLRNHPAGATNFLPFWSDVMRHVPSNGADSTSEEVWVAREKILSALLARRQECHGSGGTVETAVHTTEDGVVMPALDPSVTRIKKEESVEPELQHHSSVSPSSDADDDDDSATPPHPDGPSAVQQTFLHHLGPSAEYKPRRLMGSYNADIEPGYDTELLPPCPSLEFERARAEVERPRGETEDFSLQMILPPSYIAAHGPAGLPLAAVFVPTADTISCGVVETPSPPNLALKLGPDDEMKEEQKPVTRHISATCVPQVEMSDALVALGARFSARACPPRHCPLELDVRDESALVSTERKPTNIDDVWRSDGLNRAGLGSSAHQNSRRRMLEAVGNAVKEAESTERLRPGTPFTLQVAYTPEVSTYGAGVLFVPDDPSVAPAGTEPSRMSLGDSRLSHVRVTPISREMQGDWEMLRNHKRKRVAEAGVGQSASKRICGLNGRDTIIRHSLLDMQADDTWVGHHRRLAPTVKMETV
ncbi:hypothetical protein C8F04DRAFT_1238869 [Mycena alexandri]|uniref:Uncharacterized protein n=1 Tax=Mycena alexandri TaxID=1745969 RepID=A0AAD6SDI6_9AGAR|nr:hypothetical protein C8F04DRAFT_1238869 [Mycena alexandri]